MQPTAFITLSGFLALNGCVMDDHSASVISCGTLQCVHSVRTKRCAIMPNTDEWIKYAGTPKSSSLVTAEGESLVCSVDNTKWPVSAA